MYKSQVDAVKEWLQAYRANDEYIDRKLDELRVLRAKMMNPGAQELSDMPRAPSKQMDKMADYVIRAEKLEISIQNAVDVQEECRKAIESLLELLDKPEESMIIKYRYLFGMEWNDVMDRLYQKEEEYKQKMEAYRRRMYRCHEDALYKMARGWSGNGESL